MDTIYQIIILIIIVIGIILILNFIYSRKKEKFQNYLDIEDLEDSDKNNNQEEIEDNDYANYSTSSRAGNGASSDIVQEIENNTKNMEINDNMGVVESDPFNASYSSNNKKFTTEELYDSKLLLPGKITSEEKEWLDLPPEAVKISDKNLITVNRPVGIDTVGQTLRNASHDLRGNGVPNPKIVVSPWNQSTIDADINTKGWCD